MTWSKPNLALFTALAVVLAAACSVETADRVTVPPPPAATAQAQPEAITAVQPQAAEATAPDSAAGRLAPAPEARADLAAALKQSAAYAQPAADYRQALEPLQRETYAHFNDNPLRRVTEQPFSTFSIDVDTGSYSNMRRMLNAGSRPLRDAIRTEELINYFSYDYPRPVRRSTPFSITTEVGPTPWNPATRLLHIGIQGYDVPRQELPPANLVFLVDVSGSMQSPDKLELLKSGLKLLARQLDQDDRVSLVVYAGASGVVLEPTPGDRTATITAALDALTAGGSTNGAAGIRLAYAVARQAYIKDGINRVILATDGDFNVGTVNFEALQQLVEEQRASGIGLTTLGFGSGNYNDRLMEQLADAGNGNYAYIDTLSEANKSLVDELSSTLFTIAKDVKIQVEFNPATVAEYRLIGYENRMLARADFENDRVDAGEIGAGHAVTAVYELALTGSKGERLGGGRYQPAAAGGAVHSDELAMVRVRYKLPQGDTSTLVEAAVLASATIGDIARTSDRYRFAAAVAGFGQLLRDGKYTGAFDYDDVLALARAARGDDPFGYRGEFLQLVNLAASL
ncbi:MAG: VWA domain-containing protein [Pseudomonadota bacterium]